MKGLKVKLGPRGNLAKGIVGRQREAETELAMTIKSVLKRDKKKHRRDKDAKRAKARARDTEEGRSLRSEDFTATAPTKPNDQNSKL